MPRGKPFWSEGVRFECQGSGRCCTSRGSYGFVYLTPEDEKRMAAHLKLPLGEFRKKHCETTRGLRHLKDPEKDCEFLVNNSCSAYEGRPEQCRTWPFWPENMNARTWQKDVVEFCPGIGKGRLYTPDEIREQMKRDPLT